MVTLPFAPQKYSGDRKSGNRGEKSPRKKFILQNNGTRGVIAWDSEEGNFQAEKRDCRVLNRRRYGGKKEVGRVLSSLGQKEAAIWRVGYSNL